MSAAAGALSYPAVALAAHCPPGSATYKETPTSRSICGSRFLPQTSVRQGTFGSKITTYATGSGETLSFITAPSKFDSAHASPAELEAYGVPPEPPHTSPEYVKWRAMIDNGIVFEPLPSVVPVGTQSTTASGSLLPASQPGSSPSASPSSNWSGYVDVSPRNEFTQASVYYREPILNTETPCEKTENSQAAIWSGLGGNNKKEHLGQDGTEFGSIVTFAQDEGWTDLPPAGSQPFKEEKAAMPMFATPGEMFEASTQWIERYREGKREELYLFYEYNFATKKAQSLYRTGAYQGRSADFILEELSGRSLPAIGDVKMQGFANFGNPVSHFPHVRDVLEGELGEIDASPTSLIGGDEFYDDYQHCEKGEEGEAERGEKEGAAPGAATGSATSVGEHTATLHAAISPHGNETKYAFEYGTETENYSNSTNSVDVGAGEGEDAEAVSVGSLEPGTTYHYRAVARSGGGVAIGTESTFKTTGTPPPPAPTVTALTAGAIGPHAATLEATIEPHGVDTHYYFEYGTGPGLYEHDEPAPPGADAGSGVRASVPIAHLRANTTYYFRVVAESSSGTTYSPESEFHTRSAWAIQATVNPHGMTEEDRLAGVSCWAESECVAVGTQDTEEETDTLAEKSSSGTWALQSTANPLGATGSFLEGVSCRSGAECMAVGHWVNASAEDEPLSERWNGSSWSIDTPLAEGTASSLTSVSCASAKECVAVGYYIEGSPAKTLPLIEKWNGKKWAAMKPAKLSAEDEEAWFTSVSCPAEKACEAVGSLDSAIEAIQPLAESLSGSSWKSHTVPISEDSSEPELRSVACSSTTECTAVGRYLESSETNPSKWHALASHWNGAAWSLEESVDPIAKPGVEAEAYWELTAISCPSTTSCVAVGLFSEGKSGATGLLGEYWNGTMWEADLPETRVGALRNALSATSCPIATACTAVGYTEKSASATETLAEGLAEP